MNANEFINKSAEWIFAIIVVGLLLQVAYNMFLSRND